MDTRLAASTGDLRDYVAPGATVALACAASLPFHVSAAEWGLMTATMNLAFWLSVRKLRQAARRPTDTIGKMRVFVALHAIMTPVCAVGAVLIVLANPEDPLWFAADAGFFTVWFGCFWWLGIRWLRRAPPRPI